MNEQLRPASLPVTTQAAEGLPRRRWSVAEIREMMAKGIILEDERFGRRSNHACRDEQCNEIHGDLGAFRSSGRSIPN
jgi:hypothetical protein